MTSKFAICASVALSLTVLCFGQDDARAEGMMSPKTPASPSAKAPIPAGPDDVEDPADIAIKATAVGPGDYHWTATTSASPTTVSTTTGKVSPKQRAKDEADLMDALGSNISAAATTPTTPAGPTTNTSPSTLPPAPPVGEHGKIISSGPNPNGNGETVIFYSDGTEEHVKNGVVTSSRKLW